MPPTHGFRWKMGDWAGGSTAVHQAYKPYLVLNFLTQTKDWAMGVHEIQPRDTTQQVINGLGFEPDAILFMSYRPQYANGVSDSAFGARGGGMTHGAAGHGASYTDWSAAVTYDPGDVVRHNGRLYEATSGNTNDPPPSANWDLLAFEQFSGSTRIRHAFEAKYTLWREDACLAVVHKGFEALRLVLAELDADGFKLNVPVNLYDQASNIYWLAFKGHCKVGKFSVGASGIPMGSRPEGAVFLSTKSLASEAGVIKPSHWNHMTGFASRVGGQSAIWGGGRNDNWDWTTERWEDDAGILLCNAADGSFFAGASVQSLGRVTDWHAGGLDLQWYVDVGQPFRVGYLLFADVDAEHGILETNWETRPGGSQNDYPGGVNFQPTGFRPEVILMAATNYNFRFTETDPFDLPRSPGTFHQGGSGGIGWHVAPFSDLGYDAYGIHTYGNSVAERGRYANSGTQVLSRYILAGQGSNVNPPAYHQHSVNVIPNPVMVGTNHRDASRVAHRPRALLNPSEP